MLEPRNVPLLSGVRHTDDDTRLGPFLTIDQAGASQDADIALGIYPAQKDTAVMTRRLPERNVL